MNSGRTVFSQLISFLPDREFRRCVARYGGNRRLREFSCWDQYLTMAFAQLTYRESLRDIEACLRSLQGKLYHIGFRGQVSRSTLADANENRDWRIFADFARVLIGMARPLYAHDPIGVDLKQTLYALDSSTIDLCLSLFPWARFRKHKAAVKMHTLLDLHGNIPTFISITDGKVRIPMMSISHSDLMPIRLERSDARLFQFEIVIDISQGFCSFYLAHPSFSVGLSGPNLHLSGERIPVFHTVGPIRLRRVHRQKAQFFSLASCRYLGVLFGYHGNSPLS